MGTLYTGWQRSTKMCVGVPFLRSVSYIWYTRDGRSPFRKFVPVACTDHNNMYTTLCRSSMNIVSCNWYPLVPAFLLSTDSLVEVSLFLVIQQNNHLPHMWTRLFAEIADKEKNIIVSKSASCWVLLLLINK